MGFLFCFAGAGCASVPSGSVANPVLVRANNKDFVWRRTVDVLHDYHFQIARENKIDGLIETEYRVGAGLLEPWHPDAVGFHSRLEGSLQSIRRRVVVHVTPAEGGYWVGVQAFKELEDLAGLAANSPGGATFQENQPLQRDLNLVVGQSAPSGWILLGRDRLLEQEMLRHLQTVISR